MSQTISHIWPLLQDVYNIISPVLSCVELECPLLFVASLLETVHTWDTRQQQTILGITVPLLSYHFYSIYLLKRQQSTNRPDVVSSVQKCSPEEIQSLAEQIRAYEKDPAIGLGLSSLQVKERRAQYGFNETWKEPKWLDWLSLAAKHCAGSHVLILEGLAILAIYLGRYYSAVGFVTFALVNVGFSIWQYHNMNDVHRSLAGDLQGWNSVFRSGKLAKIPFRELLPGDLVQLEKGEVLGADASVICSSSQITMDQSALTGEDAGVKKQQGDTCYFSTGCIQGNGYLVVDAIAYDTFVGRTIVMVGQPISGRRSLRERSTQTIEEFKTVLRSVGSVLPVVGISLFIILALLSQRLQHREDRICFGLSIMMCIIPVYLHSILSRIRADGLAQLAKNGVLLTIHSHGTLGAEILAGTDILITDKTGTLTKNELIIEDPICLDCDADQLILCAALCIPGKDMEHNPIDASILRALEKYPEAMSKWNDHDIVSCDAFDPETKVMKSVTRNSTGETTTNLKGGPKATLDMCSVSEENADKYRQVCADFAHRGSRCFGVARKREDQDEWQLLGLLPMGDPPREGTITAVKVARALGLDVRMCAGHASAIAQATGSALGIEGQCVTTDILDNEGSVDDPEVRAAIESASIYAEVYPEHKEKIVEILQKSELRVAITGDGVNDSPCLRRADFGIAVEGAAELAQSAADAVLTEAGFITIVRGIHVSRQIFAKLWMMATCSTIITLHDLCLQVLFLIVNKEVMHPLGTVACFASGHFVSLLLEKFGKPPTSRKPARWDTSLLWREVLPMTVLFVFGTVISLNIIEHFDESDPEPNLSRYIWPSTHNDLKDKFASTQSLILLVYHLLTSRRWLFTVQSVGGHTLLQFAGVVLTQLGAVGLVMLICNPRAVAWMSLVHLYTLVGAILIRRAQSDGTWREVIDLDVDTQKNGEDKKDQ